LTFIPSATLPCAIHAHHSSSNAGLQTDSVERCAANTRGCRGGPNVTTQPAQTMRQNPANTSQGSGMYDGETAIPLPAVTGFMIRSFPHSQSDRSEPSVSGFVRQPLFHLGEFEIRGFLPGGKDRMYRLRDGTDTGLRAPDMPFNHLCGPSTNAVSSAPPHST
jgi:hypothetical protein